MDEIKDRVGGLIIVEQQLVHCRGAFVMICRDDEAEKFPGYSVSLSRKKTKKLIKLLKKTLKKGKR